MSLSPVFVQQNHTPSPVYSSSCSRSSGLYRPIIAGSASLAGVGYGCGRTDYNPSPAPDFAALPILHAGGAAHAQRIDVTGCERRFAQMCDRSLRRARSSRDKLEDGPTIRVLCASAGSKFIAGNNHPLWSTASPSQAIVGSARLFTIDDVEGAPFSSMIVPKARSAIV